MTMIPPYRRRSNRTRFRQRGFSLIEAICALLIFGVGVLGIARLQSVAVQETSSAGFRSTASLLAKNLVARMWLSDRTAATLNTAFSSPSGTGYVAWLASVTASGLPGVAANPPVVTVQGVVGGGTTPVSSSLVTITVNWRAPGDTSVHYYVETAQLK